MPPLTFPTVARKTYSAIPADECLAKTQKIWRDGCIKIVPGCDLYTHLWTTCMILRTLKTLWHGYPLETQITDVSQCLAAFHDIGKASPAFQGKLMEVLGWELPWKTSVVEDKGGHPRNSEIILEERYSSEFARMAGCHHGGASWGKGLAGSRNKEELGGNSWDDLRASIIAQLEDELHLHTTDLNKIRNYHTPTVGAVILADWLSSGMDLVHGAGLPTGQMLQDAIANAGLIPVKWKLGLSFKELFGFSPNSLQQACDGIAKPQNVYVIESGMGSGKTEAALFLAYQLLAKQQANGVYFAMPTKLTSEKIYERLNSFLQKGAIPTNNNQVEALLIHGEAWLNWILEQPSDNGQSSSEKSSWFQTKKRALLAPFAAGTVDQALLSVVNVRHRDLRAFALSGKIVIFDEIHSYDTYTGSLIVSLVQKLREWGATTIILSATLTNAARQRLLGSSEVPDDVPHSYPLISIANERGDKFQYKEFNAGVSAEVKISNSTNLSDVYRIALEHANRGEQVLWIANTVDKAQDIYRQLTVVAAGIELGLIHSRFPSCIRRQQEEYWVNILGKNGTKERCLKGRILVATQVLEQSVDVDADFLITQIAPSDMLFQRIGRLWRHRNLDAKRPSDASREALIVFPEDACSPDTWYHNRGFALPYDSYCMWRSAQIWQERISVKLPDDIRPILEETYQEKQEEGTAMKMLQGKIEKQEKLKRLAATAQGDFYGTLPDDENVTTRYSESETVQVLLLKKGNAGLPLRKAIVPYSMGSPIPIPALNASHAQKSRTAAEIMKMLVTVPVSFAPKYADFPLDFLQEVIWVGKEDIRPIRAAYVESDGTSLLNQSCLPIENKKQLSYHQKLGYCAKEK